MSPTHLLPLEAGERAYPRVTEVTELDLPITGCCHKRMGSAPYLGLTPVLTLLLGTQVSCPWGHEGSRAEHIPPLVYVCLLQQSGEKALNIAW